MGEVAVVELLAKEYPEVSFIIPHLGSFADDWRAQLALIDHLVRHPNVYAETSGVRRFDLLQEAVRRAGAQKFIFGSDGPPRCVPWSYSPRRRGSYSAAICCN
jgi:predicted TIM-barrel fold metal-dependent hydrolase